MVDWSIARTIARLAAEVKADWIILQPPVIRNVQESEFVSFLGKVADASTVKVFGTEFYLEAFRLLMEIIGPRAYVKPGQPGSVLKSRIEGLYRGLLILTFGGGVNEVQRDLISVFGLGMPMAKR